jgi:hypothetical protein
MPQRLWNNRKAKVQPRTLLAREAVRCSGWLDALVARLISHIETVSVDDVIVSVLKIVGELVSRLIQLDVIRAGHDHHDDATVLELLDRASKLRSFRPQLGDRRIDVVAHQRDRVMARVVVGLAFPFAVRRVHAHLARPRFENEPIVIEVLDDVLPPENIAQKRPRCLGIVGVNQCMN